MFCVSLRYIVEQVYFYNKLIYTPCVHECWMNKQFIPKTCWYTVLILLFSYQIAEKLTSGVKMYILMSCTSTWAPKVPTAFADSVSCFQRSLTE